MGMHTAELYLACLLYQGGRQQLLSKTFWDKQQNIWQGIANDLKNSSLPEFSDYAEEISDSIDHAQQCAAVQELIFSAF
jgi:hypothetical protein